MELWTSSLRSTRKVTTMKVMNTQKKTRWIAKSAKGARRGFSFFPKRKPLSRRLLVNKNAFTQKLHRTTILIHQQKMYAHSLNYLNGIFIHSVGSQPRR